MEKKRTSSTLPYFRSRGKIVAILLLLLPVNAKGDVIFYPFEWNFFSFSLEGTFSYEVPLNRNYSMNYWGGAGVVGIFFSPKHVARGVEAGIELRKYFHKESYQKLNLGFYLGPAFMIANAYYNGKDQYPLYYAGIVPGIKLTYKMNGIKMLHPEPYIGISVPVYRNLTDSYFALPIPRITFGIRISLIKMRNKQ